MTDKLIADKGISLNTNVLHHRIEMIENLKKSYQLNAKLDSLISSLDKKISTRDFYISELKEQSPVVKKEQSPAAKKEQSPAAKKIRKYIHPSIKHNLDTTGELNLIIKDITIDINEIITDIKDIHHQLIILDTNLVTIMKQLSTSTRRLAFLLK